MHRSRIRAIAISSQMTTSGRQCAPSDRLLLHHLQGLFHGPVGNILSKRCNCKRLRQRRLQLTRKPHVPPPPVQPSVPRHPWDFKEHRIEQPLVLSRVLARPATN